MTYLFLSLLCFSPIQIPAAPPAFSPAAFHSSPLLHLDAPPDRPADVVEPLTGVRVQESRFLVLILDEETGNPLPGATLYIRSLDMGTSSGPDGLASLSSVPEGIHIVEVRHIGYETHTLEIEIPFPDQQPREVYLEPEDSHMEAIVVSSTRTSRSIEDTPTRVEVITGEELEEKGNMRPGDIRMLLMESTGIQVQQTSAVSGNTGFRIQGLDSRYTQLLKDGFPLYSGFSGGLSIMQIPPLDLSQVEIIKGASSTLYGGGAIAGLVNLITRQPQEEPEISFLANVSTSRDLDFSGYYSQRFQSAGITVFAAHNRNPGYDPSGQGFSAIPQFERHTLNPRLTWYAGSRTRLTLASQFTAEKRLGGDMLYLNGEDPADRYFERHNSRRASARFSLEHQFTDETTLSLKNSFTFFDRTIGTRNTVFQGFQMAGFNELSLSHEVRTGSWVGGFNLWTDRFDERNPEQPPARESLSRIFGAFLQNTTEVTERFSLESGVRTDLARPAPEKSSGGFFILPRVSALYRFDSNWSMRLGGGMGYKMPEMFNSEAEKLTFRNVHPPDISETRAERSFGLNYDLNFRTVLPGDLVLRLNQLFWFTRLNDTLVLEQIEQNQFGFRNIDGSVRSRGLESNASLFYGDLKLFLGYTFVDARLDEQESSGRIPLYSPHQVNTILMLEEHDSYRIGLEAYFYSAPVLQNGEKGRGYSLFGIMAEKIWGKISVYVNFENLFDTRQTRFGPIYSGSREQPVFNDIYAPLEGRYINTGLKVRL